MRWIFADIQLSVYIYWHVPKGIEESRVLVSVYLGRGLVPSMEEKSREGRILSIISINHHGQRSWKSCPIPHMIKHFATYTHHSCTLWQTGIVFHTSIDIFCSHAFNQASCFHPLISVSITYTYFLYSFVRTTYLMAWTLNWDLASCTNVRYSFPCCSSVAETRRGPGACLLRSMCSVGRMVNLVRGILG